MIKENKVKVSIIIPVYNTEAYVRQAVESITNQTLRELEIIVINDGSTDESLAIVEQLAVADKRIQVYSQSNSGLSLARNAGIEKAHGEYIYFMDSDDLLEEDAMELCYRKCENNQLDFVFFDAVSFCEDNIEDIPNLKYQRVDILKADVIYTGNEALKVQLQEYVFTSSACLSFIRRKFLDRHQLRFYPGILHEDQLFTTLLYLLATRTACIQRTFFQRRIRQDSIMTRKFSDRNLKGYFTVVHEIIAFGKQTSDRETQEIINLYISQMLNAVAWKAHVLPLSARLRLATICLFKYKRYVSIRNICVLLIKSHLNKNK